MASTGLSHAKLQMERRPASGSGNGGWRLRWALFCVLWWGYVCQVSVKGMEWMHLLHWIRMCIHDMDAPKECLSLMPPLPQSVN